MIKTCVLTLLCSFFFTFSQAQEITYRKDVFRGNKFYQGEESLSMREIVDLMDESSPEQLMMKKALLSKNASRGLLFAGGFVLGIQLGGDFLNRQTTFILLGGFAALTMASVPFKIDANKKSIQALDMYNSNLGTLYEKNQPQNFYLNVGLNGVGVVMEW